VQGLRGHKSKEPVDRPLFNRLTFIYGGAGGGVTAPLFVMPKIRSAVEARVKERLDGSNSAVRVPCFSWPPAVPSQSLHFVDF